MNADWVSATGELLDTETATSSSEEGLTEVFRRMWLIPVEVGQIKALPSFWRKRRSGNCEEVRNNPLSADYLEYLRRKVGGRTFGEDGHCP